MKKYRIFFTCNGRKYSMVFTQEDNNKFALVTSDKGNTKRITYDSKRKVIDFFNSVNELFKGE